MTSRQEPSAPVKTSAKMITSSEKIRTVQARNILAANVQASTFFLNELSVGKVMRALELFDDHDLFISYYNIFAAQNPDLYSKLDKKHDLNRDVMVS
ncbi:unnamed protein product [Phytophthora fragariaefolia]|uniref:Unnamed protein product n=1 Tax=Phytophthora fragariaefolia TaxID=1490495 RepID=A0A9W6XQF2_9STRA|nr:unnamed protein product [Phytophthora fragariaefolia]